MKTAGVATAFLIFIPSVLFAVFPGRLLIARISVAPICIACSLCLVSLGSLTATMRLDPGIIPRLPPLPHFQPKRVQDALVHGRLVRLKWCDTCNLFRPPRASHCSVTDACIEQFDHYCPFVGAAIGKGNYRVFLAFVFATALLTPFVLSISLAHLILEAQALKNTRESSADFLFVVKKYPISVLLIGYTFFASFFVCGLAGFHLYLISIGLTTSEQLKKNFSHGNPYSKGCIRNIISVFCSVPARKPSKRHSLSMETIELTVASRFSE